MVRIQNSYHRRGFQEEVMRISTQLQQNLPSCLIWQNNDKTTLFQVGEKIVLLVLVDHLHLVAVISSLRIFNTDYNFDEVFT